MIKSGSLFNTVVNIRMSWIRMDLNWSRNLEIVFKSGSDGGVALTVISEYGDLSRIYVLQVKSFFLRDLST